MCNYRYYYFGGCGHQHTVLMSYCDDAEPLQDAACTSSSQDTITPATFWRPAKGGAHRDNEDGVVAQQPDCAASDLLLNSPAPSTASTHHTTSSSLSNSSSVLTSLASIQDSALDAASIHQQLQLRRDSETSTSDMASLSAFSIKHWLPTHTIKPGQAVSPVTTAVNVDSATDFAPSSSHHGHSLRARLDGIREQTDESCNMPDSGEMLRHIAASCQGNFSSKNIGTSGHRDSIYFDQTPSENGDTLDALDADIDAMKREVLVLREAAERDHFAPTHQPSPRSQRSRIPAPPKTSQESAAARLQKAHEQAQQQNKVISPRRSNIPAPPPPSPLDFPELSTHASMDPHLNLSSDAQDGRKPSYKDMAITGMMDVGGQKCVGPRQNKANDGISEGTTAHGTSFDADYLEYEVGDDSVIISPANVDYSPKESKGIFGSSPSKHSPRFAQPTKAFSRRADETVRKESVSPGSKVTPDGSPTKSMRTLSDRQQKRKPLPGAWMTSETSPTKDSAAVVAAKENLLVAAAESKASPELRKKPSSYMSPTKATTQRNIATLGQESLKRSSPKLQKPLARINTTVSAVKTLESPSSVAVTSATSIASSQSESINLERVLATSDFLTPAMRDRLNGIKCEPIKRPITLRDPANAVESGKEASQSSQMPRRSTVGSPTTDVWAAQAKAAGLPTVSNVVVKRRGSHGHLLAPITAKLGKLGLLQQRPIPEDEATQFSPLTTALRSVRQALPETPHKHPEPAATDSQPVYKVIPPHIRRKLNASNTSTADSTNSTDAAIDALRVIGGMSVHSAAAGRPSQTPSLRATAQEFKPMIKPVVIEDKLKILNELKDHDDLIAFRTDEQWQNMPFEERQAVTALRQMRFRKPSRAFSGFPSTTAANGSPMSLEDATRIANNNRTWEAQSSVPFPPPGLLGADVFGGTPGCVQAGQVLKPEVSPDTSAVHWTMQDINGHARPVNFGRAAPPVAQTWSSTPTISPTSTSTSPPSLQRGASTPWTIGTAMASNTYGWSGGDGREIKFVGYGPDAERDPLTPVNFNYGSGKPSMGRGPRMIGDDEDVESSAPLAPRSRRQWAERVGHSKVPCDNIDIKEAIAMMPSTQNPNAAKWLANYCFDRSCSAAAAAQ